MLQTKPTRNTSTPTRFMSADAACAPHVVISVDYEIYDFLTDNRADVAEQMLRPTNQFMDICERHGAALSIMFEMGAYFLFRREAPHLARQIESQLREAIARGHDVQLHLHPHLLPECGATFNARRATVRFRNYQRVHEPLSRDPQLFSRCKRVCEDLLRGVDPDYEMIVFRAGKYQVQPHAPVYSALAKAGFLAASNVVRGRFLRNYGGRLGYDYRAAWTGCQPYFPSSTNIGWPAEGPTDTVLEMPIFARAGSVWSFDALSGEQLAALYAQRRSAHVPLVMLGHSKNTGSRKLKALDEALTRIRDSHHVEFSTFANAARRWCDIESHRSGSAWHQAVDSCVPTEEEVTARLSPSELKRIDVAARVITSAASGANRLAVGVFGCGTGFGLLFPLIRRFKATGRVSFRGVDADPLALRFAGRVAQRWGWTNIYFGEPPGGSLDVAVVDDLYENEALHDQHLRAARRSLRRGGVLHELAPRRGPLTGLTRWLNDLRLAASWRLPTLARMIVSLRRRLGRRVGSRHAAHPLPRRLRTEDPRE
jgi:SAM-dependent methyltransferase